MITPYQELLDVPRSTSTGIQDGPGMSLLAVSSTLRDERRPDSNESQSNLSNGQFISRVFTDQRGQQFRLTFFVSIVSGEVRGHLVSAQPISVASRLRLAGNSEFPSTFYLPVACPTNKAETVYVPFYAPEKAPYFSLEFLITSQPTRAPSYK